MYVWTINEKGFNQFNKLLWFSLALFSLLSSECQARFHWRCKASLCSCDPKGFNQSPAKSQHLVQTRYHLHGCVSCSRWSSNGTVLLTRHDSRGVKNRNMHTYTDPDTYNWSRINYVEVHIYNASMWTSTAGDPAESMAAQFTLRYCQFDTV